MRRFDERCTTKGKGIAGKKENEKLTAFPGKTSALDISKGLAFPNWTIVKRLHAR